jgi:predicted metal-dependent hydrolase
VHRQLIEKDSFKKRVARWADRMDVEVNSIVLQPMSTKWASYSSSGRLTFDTELLRLPSDLQDYVIVHELLHCHVPNHGKLWKILMRVHVGDYKSLEDRLPQKTWR